MESRLKAKRATARERDAKACKQRLERARKPIEEFLKEQEALDAELEAENARLDAAGDEAVYANVYVDGQKPPSDSETWEQMLQKRQEMQSMMEQYISTRDLRAESRGVNYASHPISRSVLSEDPEVVVNEHLRRHKLKKRLDRETSARQTLPDELMPIPEPQQPRLLRPEPIVLFENDADSASDAYTSSDSDSTFEAVEQRGAFDWKQTVGGDMFPDMSEQIVRMLLEVPFVKYFWEHWTAYNRECKRFRYIRPLVDWKFMTMETCMHVDQEFFDPASNEYTLELTFRQFRRGELEEIKEDRDRDPGGVITKERFADHALDFLRAQLVLAPIEDKGRKACETLELERKQAAQKAQEDAERGPEFAVEDVTTQSKPLHTLGNMQIEQEATDLELIKEQERKLEEKLNRRKQNEEYQKLESMRRQGGDTPMQLHAVFLYWC